MARSSASDHQAFLDAASIAPEVAALRPDYRALLVTIDGITPKLSGGRVGADTDTNDSNNELSERALSAAEQSVREELGAQGAVTQIPHVAAWREAYKAFGAKPGKARNSIEALLRRIDLSPSPDKSSSGLPRVNRLTDIYNAVSIKYRIPLGGEDLHRYAGSPRLVRAQGTEPFALISKGDGGPEPVVEHPEVGEVVWCDDEGVTCRRWNWRQCHRTALTDQTTAALFILDVLDPVTDAQLAAAGDELVSLLQQADPDIKVAKRLIRARA